MPTEGRFFQLFEEHAQQITRASRELAALMANFDDIERRTLSIETLEKCADKIAHGTIELLHKTFITPIDRDDSFHDAANAIATVVSTRVLRPHWAAFFNFVAYFVFGVAVAATVGEGIIQAEFVDHGASSRPWASASRGSSRCAASVLRPAAR